jgi:hypothetical protein
MQCINDDRKQRAIASPTSFFGTGYPDNSQQQQANTMSLVIPDEILEAIQGHLTNFR